MNTKSFVCLLLLPLLLLVGSSACNPEELGLSENEKNDLLSLIEYVVDLDGNGLLITSNETGNVLNLDISEFDNESTPASGDKFLIWDGTQHLLVDFADLPGGTSGNITAIGDVLSDAAFTSSGTQGTAIWFYDVDGRGQLTIADLTAARTYTLQDSSGYLVLDATACSDLEGDALAISGGQLDWIYDSDDFAIVGGVATLQRERNFILSAAGMWPSTTSGCADNDLTEYTTNDVDLWSLDFSNTSDEYCQVTAIMPDDYDSGTITATFYWTASAGTSDDTAVWGLQARCFSNDEAIDQAWGSAQYVADNWIANGDVHITPATSAITIGGTPAPAELVQFRIIYDGDNSETLGEDMAADAQLLMVKITYIGK